MEADGGRIGVPAPCCCHSWAGGTGALGMVASVWLSMQCRGTHMFLRRCTPSPSLVDSLSKASYLARPYVLGHGASAMWKEHHIILGLQTPAGAILSKFRLQDVELSSLHHRAFLMIFFFSSFVKTRFQKAISFCSIA